MRPVRVAPVTRGFRLRSGLSERVDDGEEVEPVEVGVASIDSADAMLAHKHRDMHIMHQVTAQIR